MCSEFKFVENISSSLNLVTIDLYYNHNKLFEVNNSSEILKLQK